MKKLLLIYNPYSGKGLFQNKLANIIDLYVKNGYEVTVYPTQSKGDARKKISKYGGNYNRIVCSGGDGTLNEVVSGVMELPKRVTIGYIPSGSTNDFAQSIRLPKNMDTASRVAINGMPLSVDIGSFNEKNFVYIAAFGLFTDVSYDTPQELKNALGHPAYLVEAALKIQDIKTARLRLKHDNGYLKGDYIFGMISNSISVGGFKGLTGKNIALDDGLFEVTLIKKPKNALDLQMIGGYLLGMNVKTNSVETFKTSKLLMEFEEETSWTLDGEFGGELKRVKIVNNKRAVKIMSGITKK